MVNENTPKIICVDCQTPVILEVGGPEVSCSNVKCRRIFQVWSKRKQDDALLNLQQQPSIRQKYYSILEDGRVLTSYYYAEQQRYSARGLLDLIVDIEAVRLLLTGIGTTVRLSVILVFKLFDNPTNDNIVELRNGIGALGAKKQEYSFFCHFVRRILKYENKCRGCVADQLEKFLAFDPNQDHPNNSSYYCWAGLWEIAYPVIVMKSLVALFVTGQILRNTVEAIGKQKNAFSFLESNFPQFKQGMNLSQGDLRASGMSDRRIRALWENSKCSSDMPLLVNSRTLPEIMGNDAAESDRLVSSELEAAKMLERILNAAKILDQYLTLLYSERRALHEQQFLIELASIIESLPRNSYSLEQSVLVNTERILKRICNFVGFRYGAICLPSITNERVLTKARWCKLTNLSYESGIYEMNQRVPDKLQSGLFNRGFVRFQSSDRNMNPELVGFIQNLHQLLHSSSNISIHSGWIGYITLAELSKPPKEPPNSSLDFPPRLMLALWERIPSSQYGAADIITDRTCEYLRQLTHEIGSGLQLWMTLLRLEKSQEGQRQLVVNYVHGLKSAIHVALAKADIIDAVLNLPESETLQIEDIPDIEGLLASIKYDLNNFGQQISLTNRFTVLDSGIERYQISYYEKPTDILEKCIMRLKEAAKRRRIEISLLYKFSETQNGMSVKCDPGALDVAFTALIDNAIKYSFDNRSIFVRVNVSDHYFIIEIEDFGQGISESDQPKIFDKYYRGAQTDPLRSVPGTGIGLTVVKSIIEAHNGNISMTSNRNTPPSGQSSSMVRGFKVVFTITLPVQRMQL